MSILTTEPVKQDIAEIIQIDPEIMHGTPCFMQTRVPIKVLFDHIDTEESLETALDEFFAGFPHIKQRQVTEILGQEKQARKIVQQYEQENHF